MWRMKINQKISIVIPVFNTPTDVLKECIASVLDQSYQNLEVILVDDGSTSKDTISILEYFKNKDERVKVIFKRNSGVAATRNIGIKESTGDFIMFVDSDDSIKKHTCEKLASYVGEDICLSICGYYTDYNKNQGDDSYDIYYAEQIRELKFDILAFKTGKYDVAVDSPWGKLFDAHIIRENCIFFPENLTRSEDAIFVLKYLDCIDLVCILHDKLYYYRDNTSSLSRNFTKQSADMLPIVLQEEKRYVMKFCENDPYFLDACNLRVINGILEAEDVYFFNAKNKSGFFVGYVEFLNFIKEETISLALNNLTKQSNLCIKDKIRVGILKSPLLFAYYAAKYFRKFCRQRKNKRQK